MFHDLKVYSIVNLCYSPWVITLEIHNEQYKTTNKTRPGESFYPAL